MRLLNFLNESRSKPIKTRDQTIDMILSYCSDAASRWLKGNKIFRATNTKGPFLDLKPTGSRKSANTLNYYTLFINNHPMWEDYPEREVICSGGSGERAFAHFANYVYYVFPFDRSKIGICPENDIWDSFEESLGEYGIRDLDSMNDILDTLYISGDSYKELRMELENTPLSEILLGWSSTRSVFDWLEEILNPKKNGFEVQPISKYNINPAADVEVWTDSECILVQANEEYDIWLENEFEDNKQLYGL